ncbi:hypothetical protein J4Q44_G00248190 [Coregonus suidteri]|uniref:Fibronectin type-III domain-containing protein n=1 Tax=Coregonus suidteri TaxID=861788 RepID=A0AAN8QND7_9TELE
MTSIRAHNITVSWTIPLIQNGEVTQYVLKANGEEVYRGRYCTPTPAQTLQPSAPSGVGPPTLQPLGPRQVRVDWEPPARPNRVIVSYTVCQRDPALPSTHRFLYDPEHSAFSGRSTTLQELTSYHSATGQTMPLLELQRETRGLQTVFLLSWSPPAQPNGRVLHYEVYRRTGQNTEVRGRQQHWCVGMLPQRVVMPVSCPTLITNQYQGLTDSKIVGSGLQFSPMSVLHVPSQSQLSNAYSQNFLRQSADRTRQDVSDGEGGQDSGVVRRGEEGGGWTRPWTREREREGVCGG